MSSPRNILLATTFLATISIQVSSAGLLGVFSWTEEYHSGQYILVMVPSEQQFRSQWNGDGLEESFEEGWAKTEEGKRSLALRAEYPKNGLYLNDESRALVCEYARWTYGRPYISKDGRYAVFPGRWSEDFMNLSDPGWQSDLADFACDGKLTASYNVDELIRYRRLKSILTWSYLRPSGESFDPDSMTYSISTEWGEEIVFDATTGKIIRHSKPIEFAFLGILVLVSTMALAILATQLRRRRNSVL